MVGQTLRFSSFKAAIAGVAALALVPQVAQAATPALAIQVAEIVSADCSAGFSPAATRRVSATAPISLAAPAQSKAAQIIGGESALDAIRARQAGTPSTHPLFAGSRAGAFEPAAAPVAQRVSMCPIGTAFPFSASRTNTALPLAAPTRTAMPLAGAQRRDLVLGSRMVPIARTSFDAQWDRVSASRSDLSATLRRAGAKHDDTRALLGAVNRWVNREIDHAEDIDLFGKSDYWADASTTLRLGRGDCEDFALLKMELLAAAGIAREDMVLTLARDTIRRRDHAVLLVKTDGNWWMLDNVGTAPLEASQAYGYRPVMSLGVKQSWLHGY